MLIFLDAETTGVESRDKICSIAILYEDKYLYELINEGKKIPASASAIHHISNEMIKNKGLWHESVICEFLNEKNLQENTLVMHNAPFYLQMLASSGFIWKGEVIDTSRVSKHLIPECDSYSLQHLRYELKLYRDEESLKLGYGIKDALYAHHALCDVLVLKLLFIYLEELTDVNKMSELSYKIILLQKFPFGKYKERYIEEICMNDRAYVEWLLSNAQDMDEDMKYSINYYLQG